MFTRTKDTDRITNEILINRQSSRTFSTKEIDSDTLDDLLFFVVYAPYAGIAGINISDGRRLFVIGKNIKTMNTINSLIQKEAISNLLWELKSH